MTQKETLTIKRTISIKAIVTSTWKEDAENELSKAISVSYTHLTLPTTVRV